jgi:U3 small nucleolar RNA-associated protein 10
MYNLPYYSFFSHLVDTLGPDEFLAPLCMLLIEKSANRVTKQSLPDAQATLALPLALVHKQSAVRQVRAMQALIDESRRQLWKLAGRDQLAFLSDVRCVNPVS